MAVGLAMYRKADLSFKNLRHQLLVGFLLITAGNGLVTWGEKYIASGVAALICSMMPIFAVLFNLISSKQEKLNLYIVAGLLLGFTGVALIFKDNIADLANPSYIMGILAIFLATSSWALGSVFNKRKPQSTNPVFNAGLQLFFGGAFLLLFSPAIDSYEHIGMIDTDALWAMLYLIIFGSVLAYTAYMYALKELPVGLVSTYAYVNPLVAVILGNIILFEPLTLITALAFITIIIGVYLVNYGYRRQHRINTIKNLAALQAAADSDNL